MEHDHDNHRFVRISKNELNPQHENKSRHGGIDVADSPPNVAQKQEQPQKRQHNQVSTTNVNKAHFHEGYKFHLTYELDDAEGAEKDALDAPPLCLIPSQDKSDGRWKRDKRGVWKCVCSEYEDSEGIVSMKVTYRPASYFSDSNNDGDQLQPTTISPPKKRRKSFQNRIKKYFHNIGTRSSLADDHLSPASKISSSSSSLPPSKYLYSENFYDTLSGVGDGIRGHLTIINMEHFSKKFSSWECETRHGTEIDKLQLIRLFLDLGFIVDVYHNPSTDDIKRLLADNDFSKTSMTVCAILSHGDCKMIRTRDSMIELDVIVSQYRQKKMLAGKPKMFIIHTCRGDKFMSRIKDEVDGGADLQQNLLLLPCEADFLFAYSTVDGYRSWRNTKSGSWFIDALVKVFREHAHKMDVERMLCRVNKIVGEREPDTSDPNLNRKTQMPCIVSQLRQDLFLDLPHGPLSL